MQGRIARIRFASDDGEFVVAELDTDDGQHAVVGPLGSVEVGQWVELEGSWGTHETYGRQFEVDTCIPSPPDYREGRIAYLQDKIEGVGPQKAESLVDAYGDEVFEMLESGTDDLDAIVGEATADRIRDQWEGHQDQRRVEVFCRNMGISKVKTEKILDTYGQNAAQIIQSDPYQLAYDIDGIGFDQADDIAREVGIPADDPARKDAALVYALKDACFDGGHTYRDATRCETEALSLMRPHLAGGDVYVDAKQAANRSDQLVYRDDPAPRLYLADLFFGEKTIAERVGAIASTDAQSVTSVEVTFEHEDGRTTTESMEPPVVNPLKGEGWRRVDQEATFEPIDRPEAPTKELSDEQAAAVEALADSGVVVLTGGPGTGKTYTIEAALEAVDQAGWSYACCAPTGRAAKRMEELTGYASQTIHRLLDYHPEVGPRVDEIHVDLLVVDEMSMVDVSLCSTLLERVQDETTLLLVGDPNQLPSVGPGTVLDDLITTHLTDHHELTQVFRQGEGSVIPTNAARIQEGSCSFRTNEDFWVLETDTDEEAVEAIERTIESGVNGRFNPTEDIQVAAPMRGNSPLGVSNLNDELQHFYQTNIHDELGVGELWGFSKGDRVIQKENDYDLHVYNGEIGEVAEVHPAAKRMRVDYGDRSVEYENADDAFQMNLAYAITIHATQGSQFPCMILPLTRSHIYMWDRTILYTAVTRATECVVCVGDLSVLKKAARSDRAEQRETTLQGRLHDAADKRDTGSAWSRKGR